MERQWLVLAELSQTIDAVCFAPSYDPLAAHLPPIFQSWHHTAGPLYFGMNMTPLRRAGSRKNTRV
ncbi:hypothetical protein DF121_24160 [Burkholderia stagnalis]|nr:hypothetical protein DF145_24795 [Burkholderia stagnalis]RQX94831.1 hypothetical protein DF121_24160 [Burkholderia stagnalis]RQY11280.1 hypothetical protein DF115_25680 [Burkholderia stagnalis]RQY27398.1 hypothetical protein DF114_25215 [Burkholderia stagnalis]